MARLAALGASARAEPRFAAFAVCAFAGTLAVATLTLRMTAAPAAAQSAYPRVHVVALSQRADRTTVAPSDVFVVTIHVRIAQVRQRLDELILGTFADCEIISNETVRTAVPGGTDFVERLTVQALAPGEATVSPAYIDAIDPSLGKPMRYSSNAIRVHVTGTAPLDLGTSRIVDTLRRLVVAAVIAVSCVAAVFVLGVLFVRRRKSRAAAATVLAPKPAAVVVPVGTDEKLARAVDAYRSARTDAALAELRGVLFERAGVHRGATLLDALHAPGAGDQALRAALLAAERALFGPALERPGAGDEMLRAIQAYREPHAANADAWTR